MPTIPQLEKLAEILEFRPEELWQEDENDQIKKDTSKKTKKTPMIDQTHEKQVTIGVYQLTMNTRDLFHYD